MKRARNNLRLMGVERNDLSLEKCRRCAHSGPPGLAAKELSNGPATAGEDVLGAATSSSNEEDAAKRSELSDSESTSEGDQTYECGFVECLWPCQHHAHNIRSRDFLWMPNATDETSLECQYCSMFEAIAKSYCADHRSFYSESIGVAHSCESMTVHFEADFVAFVQLISSCGAVNLELGLSREAEQSQWHSNIAAYIGLTNADHRSRLARSSYTDG